MKKIAFVSALTLVAALFAACGEEEVELVPAAKTAKAAAPTSAPVPEAPRPTTDTTYSYNPTDRRDPFETYFDITRNSDAPDPGQNVTELQKIDLDKLKLVAVVVGTATPMALVEGPDGKGHVVKIGTLVGRRLGQVKHIRRGELVVSEEYRDFTGKRIPHLTEMKLDDKDKPN